MASLVNSSSSTVFEKPDLAITDASSRVTKFLRMNLRAAGLQITSSSMSCKKNRLVDFLGIYLNFILMMRAPAELILLAENLFVSVLQDADYEFGVLNRVLFYSFAN